jgi:hypothetical protein
MSLGGIFDQWWLSAILIFTKFRKLKTELCRTFRISLFYSDWLERISHLISCYEMFCHNVRKRTYLFRKKYPSIFNLSITCSLSQYSHLFSRCLVFHEKWKSQISHLFCVYHFVNKTREKGTFFEIEHLTPVINTTHTWLPLPESSSHQVIRRLQIDWLIYRNVLRQIAK